MGTLQRSILGIGLFIFVILGVFPPWVEKADFPNLAHFEEFAGYSFIGSPPRNSIQGSLKATTDFRFRTSMNIAVTQLWVGWLLTIVATAGLLLITRPKYGPMPARAHSRRENTKDLSQTGADPINSTAKQEISKSPYTRGQRMTDKNGKFIGYFDRLNDEGKAVLSATPLK